MDRLFRQMDDWYRDCGQALLDAERLVLSEWVCDSKGDILLQVGGPNDYPLIQDPQFESYCRLSPERKQHFRGPSLACDWHDLPFLPNTIDGVIVAHALELAREPQLLIDEIYRVLVGEGYIMILSFNPWSLYGIKKLMSFGQDQWPWRGSFYSPGRIKAWLMHAGFKLVDYKSIYFRPACRRASCLSSVRWLEPAGQLLWPYFGAVNLIVGKKEMLKKVAATERETKTIPVGGVLETSTRNM